MIYFAECAPHLLRSVSTVLILICPHLLLFFFFADIPEIPESIKFCRALEIADFSGNPLSRWETDHNCVHHYCSAEKLKCSSSWSFLILLFSHMTHVFSCTAHKLSAFHLNSVFLGRGYVQIANISWCPCDFWSNKALQTQLLFVIRVWDWSDPVSWLTRVFIHNFPSVCCFRLPDGFTQLRTLAHLALNDVSLQTLPNDIGKYVRFKIAYDAISVFCLSVLNVIYDYDYVGETQWRVFALRFSERCRSSTWS